MADCVQIKKAERDLLTQRDTVECMYFERIWVRDPLKLFVQNDSETRDRCNEEKDETEEEN